MSFTLNDLPLLVCAVGRPHSYYSKGSFYFAIIDISLFLNHSPSEWFSEHNKKGALSGTFFVLLTHYANDDRLRNGREPLLPKWGSPGRICRWHKRTGAELAARRRIDGTGHFSLQRNPLPGLFRIGIGLRNGGVKSLGIGVQRLPKIAWLLPSSTMLPRYIMPTRSEM